MKNNKHNNLLMGSLCALGCETLYGLSYSFTKQATAGATVLSLLGWGFFLLYWRFDYCFHPDRSDCLKGSCFRFQLLGAAVIIAGVYTANSRTNVQEL